MNDYCLYYHATIRKKDALFLVGTLRFFGHICFDRTIDPSKSLFEFFVPEGQNEKFQAIMEYFEKQGIVQQMRQLPNRLRRQDL